jgi:hypothetical protein
VISLLVTLFVGALFLLMLNETIALGKGRDPVSNLVRSLMRAYPRFSYVVAVVIGMLIGHLFWQ